MDYFLGPVINFNEPHAHFFLDNNLNFLPTIAPALDHIPVLPVVPLRTAVLDQAGAALAQALLALLVDPQQELPGGFLEGALLPEGGVELVVEGHGPGHVDQAESVVVLVLQVGLSHGGQVG